MSLSPLPRVCLLVVVLSAAVPAARAARTKELLTNGGFEQGAAGWQPDARHEILQDPKAASSGKACLTGESPLSQLGQGRCLDAGEPVCASDVSCPARHELCQARVALLAMGPRKIDQGVARALRVVGFQLEGQLLKGLEL